MNKTLSEQLEHLLSIYTLDEILDYLWIHKSETVCEWIEEHEYMHCDEIDLLREDLGYYK